MLSLKERIESLVSLHGGWRPASRAVGIDVAYLQRLHNGEKSKPSADTLDKLGLERREIYVMKKQRGYYNFNIGGFFIAILVAGMFFGWIGSLAIGYIADHVEISWVSDDE